ncbi:DNA polymerase domain-containing protein [Geobacter anodireducens]|uniref:DNA-directed DNA polymerase n=1 Tax=Geobacter soli TaxID=1510391 RepID=A0A0C1U7B0_9BACT|nr:DNA polymerase domain-containing protein [Geobacter soli]KIE43535.1 DNA polymerase II [Geobacter soli]
MNDLDRTDNRLLFGADDTEGIVAAELAGRFVRLFIRTPRGVVVRDDPFHPFILLTDPSLLDGFREEVTVYPLSGPGELRFMALFREWHGCAAARDFLARHTGQNPSAPGAPYLYLPDPVHQHFLLTGKTFFKGFEFGHLRRLALDIETSCGEGFEFSNPDREGDRILSIALMEEGGFEAFLSAAEMDEREMLERLGGIIRERDPDVIEGHNIFRFDLEYIRARAARHGVKLAWGRDGSIPRVHPSRFSVAERLIDYPRWDVYGRTVIDTYFLVQIHDVSSRDLESYGLKQAAIHFGLAAPDRVYLDRQAMDEAFRTDPERMKRYNLDDTRETLALSRLLSYPWFLQARIFPYTYQTSVIRGNATKINALFLREYLHRREAVPLPAGGDGAGLEGGYVELRETGILGPIVHCDVASLYPSLMLARQIAPVREHLGLFLPLLEELRRFRLTAKARAREESDPHRRDYYAALQQTFKVLINSFYGYLGAPLHHFADLAAAAEVTRAGRQLIGAMLDWLRDRGARPVEVDTDGVYFIPPPGVSGEEAEAALVRALSATLPAGIEVELAGRYRAMFSYKAKNYALLGHDGRITVRGSALRSRGIERYLREFMGEMIRLLLTDEAQKVPGLYEEYVRRIREHRFPVEWLARTETLGESPATYQQKVRAGKRNPSAAFEIALRADRPYRAGDQISYYVTGRGKGVTVYGQSAPVFRHDPARPDENVDYYVDKLAQLMKKFAPFLPRERTLFD